MDPFYAFLDPEDNNNSKTGAVAITYAPKKNCPGDCPFKGNGCYPENFPMFLQWERHCEQGDRFSKTWTQLLTTLKKMHPGEKLRLWAAGDFPVYDAEKCLGLRDAVRGLKAWGYTHHQAMTPNRLLKDDGWWARYILECKIQGTTVNVSTESEHMVDAYAELGIPTVLAVESTETRNAWRTKSGHRVQVCPNQINSSVNCRKCMLCHERPSDMTIAFRAHGREKKANSAIRAANAAIQEAIAA